MKIQINETETYQIEMPETLDSNNFHHFLFRLNHIAKLLVKTNPLPYESQSESPAQHQNIPIVKKQHKPKHLHPWSYDRETCIKFIKMHYYGTDKALKNKIAESYYYNGWTAISKVFGSLKIKFDIIPYEVDLHKFPGIGEAKNIEKPFLKYHDIIMKPEEYEKLMYKPESENETQDIPVEEKPEELKQIFGGIENVETEKEENN